MPTTRFGKQLCAILTACCLQIDEAYAKETIGGYFQEVDRLQDKEWGTTVPAEAKLTRGTDNYTDRNLVVFKTALAVQSSANGLVNAVQKKWPIEFLIDQSISFFNSLFEPEIVSNAASNDTVESPLSSQENQLQSSLAGQTTGLANTIGDARSQREISELTQALATTPNGPFVATVESPSSVATGDFSGEEGLNIAGILNVFAYDSGRLQDGDRVRLTIRDSRGVVYSGSVTLTFAGTTIRRSARRGIVNVTITALNEGSSPPNTGGLRVSGDVEGSRSGNFELTTGRSGTLVVRVLGN